MAVYSQNGFKANTRSLIATYTVPTTDIRVSLRKGDVSVVLLWVLEQFHKTVEPLRQSDTGGYAERVIRGGVSLSNHASGTAVDARWRDHPLGKRGTFTPEQVNAIRRILNLCQGVVRWGGDYRTRADEMHFEIVASPGAVAQVASKIRDGHMPNTVPRTPTGNPSIPAYPGHPLRRGMLNNRHVRIFQTKMKARGWRRMGVDGDFGPITEDLVRQFQKEKGLTVDGLVGPKTWKAIFTAPR